MASPTQTFGDVLVVHDDASRVSWRQFAAGGLQAPVALWPSPTQRRRLDQHQARRAPLLIVMELAEPPIYLLPEEARRVPAALHRLVENDGPLCRLRVPRLDWLPAPLAGRGRRFLEAARARTGSLPGLLVPPVMLEDAPDTTHLHDDETGICDDAPVRFACRTAQGSFPLTGWRDLALRLFGNAAAEVDDADGYATYESGAARIEPRMTMRISGPTETLVEAPVETRVETCLEACAENSGRRVAAAAMGGAL
jgi:hypothetical protein